MPTTEFEFLSALSILNDYRGKSMDSNVFSTASSEKKYHYVYLIKNIVTDKKYIGVHSSDVPPVEDIGIHYFSSSTDLEFLKDQKENPGCYSYHVIRDDFKTREEAEECERYMHAKIDVARNEDYYNLCNAPVGFNGYGRVIVKDKDGNTFSVSKDDPRYLSRELVSVTKGMINVRDENGNRFRVSKDDPRWISGELVGVTKGIKYGEEARRKISESNKGVKRSEETCRKISESKKGENNPNFGRPAPNSKKIQTPDGIFASRTEAARHYGVTPSNMQYRMKRYPDQYFYP